FLLSMLPPSPTSTLFPYTTLFRSLSGLPIHVAHIPAAPFPRTPFSLTHDLPSSLMRSLSLCHRYLAAFPSTPWLPITRCRRKSRDRKSTRLNSSHSQISYAVFCLK